MTVSLIDSVEYLTGYQSIQLRTGAVENYQQALLKGEDQALTNARETFRSNIHNRHLSFSTYCSLMSKSAAQGGLWVDVHRYIIHCKGSKHYNTHPPVSPGHPLNNPHLEA